MKKVAAIISSIVILTLVVIFTLQNTGVITVKFLFWQFESALSLILFLSFVFGIIVACLFFLPQIIRGNKEKINKEKINYP